MLLALSHSPGAAAHDAPASAILLDVGLNAVDAELRLPLYDLSLALSLPLNDDPAAYAEHNRNRIEQYLRQHVQAHTGDGAPYAIAFQSLRYERVDDSDWLVVAARLQPSVGAPIGVLALDYDAIIKPVITHNALLSVRHDFRHGAVGEQARPIALLGYQLTHVDIDLSGGSWWRGFSSVFSLGMRHIVAGTDHMLFLLVLLLPAPLLAAGRRWTQRQGLRGSTIKIIKTVSGFTLGHSITLAIGALGLVEIPARSIEVLIAASILVSAAHALRPMFYNKELYLAAGFGLIHGLAFASSLTGLGYDPTVLASSILGFNLGIEVMQLAIVVCVLPWLLLLSGTSVYTPIRWLAGGFAALAAIGWIGERALDLANPIAPWVDAIAAHGPICILSLAFVSLGMRFVSTRSLSVTQ